MTEGGEAEDIYADLDPLLSPKEVTTSCDDGTDSLMDYSDVLMLQNPTATLTSRLESERKKLEMDLLLEFVVNEGTSRKTMLQMEVEFQELKKEVAKLQNLNSENDALILELRTQNINLRKNISSLYKTAKSEVEQKDLLLADANKELDRYHFRRNRSSYTRDQCTQTVIPSSTVPEESCSTRPKKDIPCSAELISRDRNVSATRKRPLPLEEDDTGERGRKRIRAKQSTIEKHDSVALTTSTSNDFKINSDEQNPESSGQLSSAQAPTETIEADFASVAPTTSNDCKIDSIEQIPECFKEFCRSKNANETSETKYNSGAPTTSTSNDSKSQPVEQSPESSGELCSSQASTKTSDELFDLLPDPVKRSFWEYELSQIDLLNRLKQSFVDHYILQSKKQTLGSRDMQASLEPDAKSSGSQIREFCDAKTSGSFPMLETRHLDSARETSISALNPQNDESSNSKRTEKSLLHACDSTAAGSVSLMETEDLNGARETTSVSSLSHLGDMSFKNERTGHSFNAKVSGSVSLMEMENLNDERETTSVSSLSHQGDGSEHKTTENSLPHAFDTKVSSSSTVVKAADLNNEMETTSVSSLNQNNRSSKHEQMENSLPHAFDAKVSGSVSLMDTEDLNGEKEVTSVSPLNNEDDGSSGHKTTENSVLRAFDAKVSSSSTAVKAGDLNNERETPSVSSLNQNNRSSEPEQMENSLPHALNAKVSRSVYLMETEDLNDERLTTSVSSLSHQGDGSSEHKTTENSLPRDFDVKVSSSTVVKAGDSNNERETTFVSSLNHQDNGSSTQERTENSLLNSFNSKLCSSSSKETLVVNSSKECAKGSPSPVQNNLEKRNKNPVIIGNKVQSCNKTGKRSGSKDLNSSNAFEYDVVQLYRRRKQTLPAMIRRQIYNYCSLTKEK